MADMNKSDANKADLNKKKDAAQADFGRDNARKAGDDVKNAAEKTSRAGAEVAERATDTMRKAGQTGLSLGAQATEHSLERLSESLERSNEGLQEAAQESSENLRTLLDASPVLAGGFENISREWMNHARDMFQMNVEGWNNVLQSRTPQDAVAAHSALLKQNLESFLDTTSKIGPLSADVARQAAEKIGDQQDRQGRQQSRAA